MVRQRGQMRPVGPPYHRVGRHEGRLAIRMALKIGSEVLAAQVERIESRSGRLGVNRKKRGIVVQTIVRSAMEENHLSQFLVLAGQFQQPPHTGVRRRLAPEEIVGGVDCVQQVVIFLKAAPRRQKILRIKLDRRERSESLSGCFYWFLHLGFRLSAPPLPIEADLCPLSLQSLPFHLSYRQLSVRAASSCCRREKITAGGRWVSRNARILPGF